MAVDANVLVFERAKEEHVAGRSPPAATIAGFSRAWSAIADSNASTLLAAGLLFFYASGAVRGFGITVSLGVVVSMSTALVVIRTLAELLLRSRRLASRPIEAVSGATAERSVSASYRGVAARSICRARSVSCCTRSALIAMAAADRPVGNILDGKSR